MLSVVSNLGAMNAQRQFNINGRSVAKRSEKLSSGYKINRAADDAAGLTISEKMRRQIRGLTQASANTQDGVSFCQIADGALDEVQDMFKRCQELATKASNETNTDADREAMQAEIKALTDELDRVHESCIFNELRVFPDGGLDPSTLQNSSISSDGLSYSRKVVAGNSVISLEFLGTDGSPATVEQSQASGAVNKTAVADSDLAKFAVDAAANAVQKLSQAYPNLFSKASSDNIQIGLELSPKDNGNTLATASISLSSGSTSSVASYKMWIDTKDYPIEDFNTMSDAKKADLAATISHEMTHLVMYDTVTGGMFGTFPKWFVEGMAQTTSGDNGWMSHRVDPSSTDTEIKNFQSQLTTLPYGTGYAACMYLGQLASGESTVSSENIAKGLDKLLTQVADNIVSNGSDNTKILDDAINTVTAGKYTSVNDFQKKFSESDPESLSFMKDFINARGTTGAGSILGSLSQPEADVFAPASLGGGSYNSYKINADNQWYSNAFGTGFVFPKNLPSTNGGGGQGNDREGFTLQVGAEHDHYITVKQFNISKESLLNNMELDVSTVEGARASIKLAQDADAKISAVRSYYGAVQNRLEHTIANLDNVVENTTAAESRIRDTDMALEMVGYSKDNILMQASQAMLSQAMQNPQSVLSLLQ